MLVMMRSKILLGKVELTCRNRSTHLPSIIMLIMLRMLMNVMMENDDGEKLKWKMQISPSPGGDKTVK